MRILITGSRDWTSRMDIARHILRYLNEHTEMLLDDDGNPDRRDTSDVVIVHGAARGADLLAAEWAEGCDPPIKTEAHPIGDFIEDHGRGAGYARNAHMVRAGADVCIAFINLCRQQGCPRTEVHGSHGASHCSDLAEKVGIPVIRVRTFDA